MPAITPTTFEIKSANLPLVALLLKSADLLALQSELISRFGDIPDFFDQDALVVDLSPLQTSVDNAASQIDFHSLLSLLRSYRLNPIAVKGGSAAQMTAALDAGLMRTPDAYMMGSRSKKPGKSTSDDANTAPSSAPEASASPPTKASTADTTVVPTSGQLSALVVDKPLRSGQQIYARGRDLVVLAMVSAGAEVIADGHIHVYAPLRGKAIAGARGNIDARIFALSLEAQLLSIAGVYRTGENPLPDNVQGKPAQVRLVTTADGDKLIMDAM